MLDVRMIKKAGLEVAKEYDFRDDGAYFSKYDMEKVEEFLNK